MKKIPVVFAVLLLLITAIYLNACRKILSPVTIPSPWVEATGAAAFSGRTQHASLVYAGRMWVIAGAPGFGAYTNDVWSSDDGITWDSINPNPAFSARYGLAAVVYTNPAAGPAPGVEKMWLIGGENTSYRSEVWYSTDGITWTLATNTAAFGNRTEMSSVVFNGKMWVIAGIKTGNVLQNDVYSSSDGVNWSLETSNAGFPKRKAHRSVVYDGKIWVIAGNINTGFLNDVWYSGDGITWEGATLNAEFTKRYASASEVYNNKMWVLGGADSISAKNDCWFSTDGIIWTQAENSTVFNERAFHSSLVFDSKMWVIAGGDPSFLNSVWRTQ